MVLDCNWSSEQPLQCPLELVNLIKRSLWSFFSSCVYFYNITHKWHVTIIYLWRFTVQINFDQIKVFRLMLLGMSYLPRHLTGYPLGHLITQVTHNAYRKLNDTNWNYVTKFKWLIVLFGMHHFDGSILRSGLTLNICTKIMFYL